MFGQYFGKMLWMIAAGKDQAVVEDDRNYVPERISYGHTFSDWTDDSWKVGGEFAKAVKQVCYRLRGYRKKSDTFFGHVGFQSHKEKGFSFTFRAPGRTNLDDYVLRACLQSVLPMLFYCRREGKQFRSIRLGTTELDIIVQTELFFQENQASQRMYRAIDYLNNRLGLENGQSRHCTVRSERKYAFYGAVDVNCVSSLKILCIDRY